MFEVMGGDAGVFKMMAGGGGGGGVSHVQADKRGVSHVQGDGRGRGASAMFKVV